MATDIVKAMICGRRPQIMAFGPIGKTSMKIKLVKLVIKVVKLVIKVVKLVNVVIKLV